MPYDEERQILADEAAQQQDPRKVFEIIISLTAAIDERLKATRQLSIAPRKNEQLSPKLRATGT